MIYAEMTCMFAGLCVHVFLPVLHINRSQLQLEGSCIWDGLWAVIIISITLVCKNINLC